MSDTSTLNEVDECEGPALIYVADDDNERRRQWCVDLGCYYFAGHGVEKALKAAAIIEKYLLERLPKQV